VTPPAAVATAPQTLAVLEPALPAPVTASSAAPTAPAPSEASPPRGGLSQVDRSLASRVRRLERINQILFLATVFAGLLALVLGGAYVVQRDMRSKEIAAARDEAIREVRAEFERAQPVTKPKVVDLPSEPEPPPAQVGAPSAAPPIRR
jgi:hypothetical protein